MPEPECQQSPTHVSDSDLRAAYEQLLRGDASEGNEGPPESDQPEAQQPPAPPSNETENTVMNNQTVQR